MSEPPAVGGVEKDGEWYRDKNEKEVAASQTHDEHVRLGHLVCIHLLARIVYMSVPLKINTIR